MTEAHARLGPSSPRWPNCPGAPREEAAYPDIPGEAAIDGTGSHLLLEMCVKTLNANLNIHGFVGKTIGAGHHDKPAGWVVKADRCDRVKLCFDYINSRNTELGGVRIDAEDISNPGKYFGRDDWWGTCDVTLTSFVTDGTLEVIDYKDGQGYVDVKNNTQLIAYAGGKLAKYIFDEHGNGIPFDVCGIKVIRMTIVQPKTVKDPIRIFEMSPEKLWEKITELAAAAALTDDPNAPLIAGDWCKWCPHKPNCPEQVAQGTDALVAILKSSSGSVESMTGDQLAEIMALKKNTEDFFKRVDVEITTRVNKGVHVPYYGKGKSKGSNIWVTDAEKKLLGMGLGLKKADLNPTSFISPAALLKREDISDRHKKKIQKELIKYVEGEEKVIRTNIRLMSVEDMFADVPKLANPEASTENFDDLTFN